ncbi:MAG: glycerol kinase GlpK, partial [Thermoguttaceae bacterium]|nr:glycerol kinase GlpK [Thermoguttaceae bacterium]
INPYFSGSKIRWILDHVDGAMERARKGELLFGTIDTWLIWNLTRGTVHATDFTNASRTMLFNIHALCWDEEILAALGIPPRILPEVRPTASLFGYADLLSETGVPTETGNGVRVPIGSVVGDQQASLFGQCCFHSGDVKNTYGTGCFMLMNTGNETVVSQHGLLTTIAWKLENEPVEYALEGSVFIGGSAVQWLRDGMRLIAKSSDCEESSRQVEGSDGLYVVPAFVGLGTPYWDNDARGAVFGITRATRREHFINATVESVAYQSKDVMDVMKEEAAIPIPRLAVDGGASTNDYLMQFQSDILNCPVARPVCLETTALGAAYLAGLTVGFWKDKNELVKFHRIEKTFVPGMTSDRRQRLCSGWKKAVEATRIFKPENGT